MSAKLNKTFIMLLLLWAALLFCTSCGSDDGKNNQGDGDIDGESADSDLWDAGPDPDGDDSSGYAGYGNQGDDKLCAQDPCIHGKCVVQNGAVACICTEGYAGKYCQTCADGYEPDGLDCVPVTPCSDFACNSGICRVEDDAAVCDCDSGYKGLHCDECADGYHEDNLECIPD